MKKLALILILLLPMLVRAQSLNITLTVQEALYPGGSTGVARTNEPFCRETGGVPIPDALGLTGTSTLTMTGGGVTAGQFRILGKWPSGNIKWLQVCGVISSLSAGGTSTITLANNGSGNFGGNNLASLSAGVITVNNTGGATACGSTGATCFTIKAAGNFNVLDTVKIDTTTLVATHSSAAEGLVILGPSTTNAFPDEVTCGTGAGQSPCTNAYSSANDANSTCSIEVNGPVMAEVACYGTHVDGSGNPYMHFTDRLYFFVGKNYVVSDNVLRNADYSTLAIPSVDCHLVASVCTGQTFNVSDKGFQSYELREPLNGLSGTITATLANETGTPIQTTVTGSDAVDIYQGQSNFLAPTGATFDYVGNAAISTATKNLWTPDLGYHITKNGTDLGSGDVTKFPQGWADLTDGSGNGVEVGVNLFAANWPKSLEFLSGGTEMRIGIRPNENSGFSYISWPSWDMNNVLFMEFHTIGPTTTVMANHFLSFQHFLTARADIISFNNSGVFYGHTILDPTTEDNFYLDLANKAEPAVATTNFCNAGVAPCSPDRGTSNATYPLAVFRGYSTHIGGGGNQEEFRWDDLLRFLQRGQTGRYLTSLNFYRFQSSVGWAHSDGTNANGSDGVVNHFQWQNRPQQGTTNPELDSQGLPIVTQGGCQSAELGIFSCAHITNSTKAFTNWVFCGAVCGSLHSHWYGLPDAYYLTGDENFKEAMWAIKAWFLNPNTYQGGNLSTGCTPTAFCYARAKGIGMMGAARGGAAFSSWNDSDGTAMLAEGVNIYTAYVKPQVCESGFPSGCTAPPVTTSVAPSTEPQGISPVRGNEISARNPGWCPKDQVIGNNYYRITQTFQHSILEKGMMELRNIKGSSWSDYNTIADLAFGTARFALTEMLNDDKGLYWQSFYSNGFFNGPRFEAVTDIANACPTASNQLDTSGTVTTNGRFVTWISGTDFTGVLVNDSIGINGTQLTVCTVTDTTHLIVSATNDCTTPATTGGSGLNIGAGILQTASGVFIPVPWVRGLVTPVAYGNNFAKAGNGTVNITGGVNVTAVTGPAYPADPSSPWDGLQVAFGGSNQSTICAVPTTTTITLCTSVNNASGQGMSVNPGVYQVSSSNYDVGSLGTPCQGCWDIFNTVATVTGDTSWQRVFREWMQALAYHTSGRTADFGNIDIWDNINAINNQNAALKDVLITNFVNNGGASYTFSFTTPPGAQSPLRIKWCLNPIQTDLTQILRYDNLVTQTFGINPNANCAWFAANAVVEPPLTPGVKQTVTITGTGSTLLTVTNFSVKVAVPNIIWTDVLTYTPCLSVNSTCYNGYFDLKYDLLNKNTIVYSTSSGSGSQAIYSTRIHRFDSSTSADSGPLTDNGQTGTNGCLGSTSTLPATFHPVGMGAIDTKRNRMWQVAGVGCIYRWPELWYLDLATNLWHQVQPVNFPVTITSKSTPANSLTAAITTTTRPVSISIVTNQNVRDGTTVQIDNERGVVSGSGCLWAGSCTIGPITITLSAPVLGTIAATHLNGATVSTVEGMFDNGSLVYDNDDDVLFLLAQPLSGGLSTGFQVYCPTDAGTLSSNQTAVGCSLPDDFTNLSGVSICADPTCRAASGSGKVPPGLYYPAMEYDTANHQIIDFAGCCGGRSVAANGPLVQPQVFNNHDGLTFTYAPHSFTWTNKKPLCLGFDCQPTTDDGSLAPAIGSTNAEGYRIAHAYGNGKYYYHYDGPFGPPVTPSVNAGALAITQDWVYDPVANTWTELQTGTGPRTTETLAFDPLCNGGNGCLISWATNLDANGNFPGIQNAHMWVGKLPAQASTSSGIQGVPCPQCMFSKVFGIGEVTAVGKGQK